MHRTVKTLEAIDRMSQLFRFYAKSYYLYVVRSLEVPQCLLARSSQKPAIDFFFVFFYYEKNISDNIMALLRYVVYDVFDHTGI